MSDLELKGSLPALRSACRSRTSPPWTSGSRAPPPRQAAVVGVLACVLAIAGVLVVRNDSPKAVEPVRPPDNTPVQALEYPGPVMEALEAGTYELTPSPDPVYPRASITLPEGWNAWQGPNRFDVNDPAAGNEEALEEITWYVGILIVEVDGVANAAVHRILEERGRLSNSTSESLVRAIRQVRAASG